MGPLKKQERKFPAKPSTPDQAGSYFLCSDSSVRRLSAWEPWPWTKAVLNLTQEQAPEDGERVSRKFHWKEKQRHTGKFHQNELPHSFYSVVVDGSPILQHGPAQKKHKLSKEVEICRLNFWAAPFLTLPGARAGKAVPLPPKSIPSNMHNPEIQKHSNTNLCRREIRKTYR